MLKKYRVLTAPFAYCAISFVLVVSMLLTGITYPARSVIALSAESASEEQASLPAEEADDVAASEPETGTEVDEGLPARAETMSAFKESAPPSCANYLVDMTPKLRQEIRTASAELEDATTTLPVENFILYNLSDEEYKMLCWCVEGEARGKSLKHREIIAQVVFNRVFNDRFPNTVEGVLFAPSQFNAMDWYTPGYYDKFVTPLSEEAVNAVISGEVEDLSQGALYFCNPNTAHNVEWFDNCLVTLFELENHRFYKAR